MSERRRLHRLLFQSAGSSEPHTAAGRKAACMQRWSQVVAQRGNPGMKMDGMSGVGTVAASIGIDEMHSRVSK